MSVDAESLRTLAEVAAGLIGFAAVSIGLSNRSGELRVFDKIRFYWIVCSGLSIVLYSYVPNWLMTLEASVTDIWFYSTLILCITLPLFSAMVFGPFLTSKDKRTIIAGKEERKWFLRVNLLNIVLALAIVQNLASWPFESNQVTYELMLLIGMAMMAYNFVHLVVVPGGRDGPA